MEHDRKSTDNKILPYYLPMLDRIRLQFLDEDRLQVYFQLGNDDTENSLILTQQDSGNYRWKCNNFDIPSKWLPRRCTIFMQILKKFID
ncbi:hypothetical protein TI05_11095 [Achromatium sp. WMS3]|nr:hypothetical protein TI05_11095 [Achromatium sp. WMS3]